MVGAAIQVDDTWYWCTLFLLSISSLPASISWTLGRATSLPTTAPAWPAHSPPAAEQFSWQRHKQVLQVSQERRGSGVSYLGPTVDHFHKGRAPLSHRASLSGWNLATLLHCYPFLYFHTHQVVMKSSELMITARLHQ